MGRGKLFTKEFNAFFWTIKEMDDKRLEEFTLVLCRKSLSWVMCILSKIKYYKWFSALFVCFGLRPFSTGYNCKLFFYYYYYLFFFKKKPSETIFRGIRVFIGSLSRDIQKKKEQNRVTYFSIHNTYTFKVLIQIRWSLPLFL